MILQHLFIVLQITTLPALCFKIKNVETRTAKLFIGNDGKLLDSSGIPDCGPANKIILKSYTYNQMLCTKGSCNSVNDEKLSDSTVLQLHQNCSFRQTCETLQFPVPSSTRHRPSDLLAVTIQYQCIDDQKSILNMCEKHKMNFNDTLHLTFKYYTKNLKNCVCWVNEGPFSLKIMDVRLKSRKEEVCSAARFVINSHHYTCDPQSDSYGAVFGEMFQDHISVGAFISLVPNSNSTLPEMVWIQLTPEESSHIDCHGDRIASEKSTDIVMVTTSQSLSTKPVAAVVDTTKSMYPSVTTIAEENASTTPPRPSENNDTGFWIVICTLILLLVTVSVITLLVIARLKRYVKTLQQPNGEQLNHPNNYSGEEAGPTCSETIAETTPAIVYTTDRQNDQSKHGLTRSELDLIENSNQEFIYNLIRNENLLPFKSLSNIKSATESYVPAHQNSVSCSEEIDQTRRKQIEVELSEIKCQVMDQPVAKSLPAGIQTSDIRKGPVTTVNTPSTSLFDMTPHTSGPDTPTPTHFYGVEERRAGDDLTIDDVNDGQIDRKLAENIMADHVNSDFELQNTERSHLLKDTNAEISLTERKVRN